MNRIWPSLLGLFIIFLTQASIAQECFENLSLVKQRLIQYHDSGQYHDDISDVVRHALSYLRFRINQNQESQHPKSLAIVFDIDETSLSNYNDMQALDFGGTNSDYIKAEEKGTDPAIPSTLTLYQYAKNHHITVFFVTGRKEALRLATSKNLKRSGYKTWQYLYMKPNDYHKESVVPYKSSIRKTIEKKGYDIVINIGDQFSDLKGGFADMVFKVPDPYYFIS
jgi:acid phosphatase